MNIDSALRMIDNEISNFRAKLKCKLAWCCQALGEVTAQDREGGGGGGVVGGVSGEGRAGEERRDKLVAKDCSDDGDV